MWPAHGWATGDCAGEESIWLLVEEQPDGTLKYALSNLDTGLYGMVFVALVALFIGGLMVGRSPEHRGRRIGPPEMKMVAVYTLLGPATVLVLTALAVLTQAGRDGLTSNTGPHGFTEIFFAYTSALANNSQNMAGLSANSIFYNVTTMIAMLVGRWGLAVLALALAGRFAAMSPRPASSSRCCSP